MSRVTLADVAAAAGVSISTASVAFSGSGPIAEATKERVRSAAQALGYQGPNPLAASLRRGRSGVIAVIAPPELRYSFRDPVSIQILDGISAALSGAGYGMLLIPHLDPEGEVNPLLHSASFDAAISLTSYLHQGKTAAALKSRSIPWVALGDTAQAVVQIEADDRAGMRRLAAHLLETGHDRLGLATLPWTSMDRSGWVNDPLTTPAILPVTGRRFEGLTGYVLPEAEPAAAEPAPAAAEPAAPDSASPAPAPAPEDDAPKFPVMAAWECSRSLVDEGITAGHALLAAGARTLVGFSDLIAAGLLIAAQEEGRKIPEEVSVAGFDGIDLPWLADHRLTTVRQPMISKGQLAAQAAITLAEGEVAESIILETELVVGTTTKAR